MSGARAEDFRKHYPQVAKEIDEWNELVPPHKMNEDRHKRESVAEQNDLFFLYRANQLLS